MPKTKSDNKKKTADRSEINPSRNDDMRKKLYVTQEVETSITLLESVEEAIVLDALLFLSKYGDIQTNNLIFLQSHGLLPKLASLLTGHNICILRMTLRLLSELLNVDATLYELNENDRYDERITVLNKLFLENDDEFVKKFSIKILARIAQLDTKLFILLQEKTLVKGLLKIIKNYDDDLLINALEILNKAIDVAKILESLPQEPDYEIPVLYAKQEVSNVVNNLILNLFEKLTYYCEEPLQNIFKNNQLIEHLINIILNPNRVQDQSKCLKIIRNCMNSNVTNSYFLESFEFLKFAAWSKTCPEENDLLLQTADIFLKLSEIDKIRQMLFDLSIEDTILSFLRSEDKRILNLACEAISNMSVHKFCCDRMLTAMVARKLVAIMQRTGDEVDPLNETCLKTLHNFALRLSRTIYMISNAQGTGTLLNYLRMELPTRSLVRIIEILNMFITNNQLRDSVMSPDFFDDILALVENPSEEIRLKSLEIMINCLSSSEFRQHFYDKNGVSIAIKLLNINNEKIIRLVALFIHNCMMHETLAMEFIHQRLLLVLKSISESIKCKVLLIDRIKNHIYDTCLPIKFFETGRLEITDRITGRFYLIIGKWTEPFPFLEVLELRKISTKSTIYVVNWCERDCAEVKTHCLDLQAQLKMDSITSLSTYSLSLNSIKYGKLSPDPFLLKYLAQVMHRIGPVNCIEEKIKILAEFVDRKLCGPDDDTTTTTTTTAIIQDKLHNFHFHISCIKQKLGTNMIPIGYLRLGFRCERALLFKALADQLYIPCTLVKGNGDFYWNEVALIQKDNVVLPATPPSSSIEHQTGEIEIVNESNEMKTFLKMFVVDLINNIGHLLPLGSRDCNIYCDIKAQ